MGFPLSDAVKKIEDVSADGRFAPESARGVRAASTAPSTWSEDDRSFEFVLATPSPVVRWYRDLETYERFQAEEVLPVETAVLMSESGRSIPILDSHQSWSVGSVVGIVTEMRRENGQILCRGRLSGRDSAKDVVDGVREGVLTNISVGYDTPDMELVTDAVTGKRTMRAKRWVNGVLPLYLSFGRWPVRRIRTVESRDRIQTCLSSSARCNTP